MFERLDKRLKQAIKNATSNIADKSCKDDDLLVYTYNEFCRHSAANGEDVIKWTQCRVDWIKAHLEEMIAAIDLYPDRPGRERHGQYNRTDASLRKRDRHDGGLDAEPDKYKTNQYEKNIAKAFFRLCRAEPKDYLEIKNEIGDVRDYEVPIFRHGKRNIDLVSTVNEQQLRIIELKNNSSTESMLRCILECYTYSRFLNRKKFNLQFRCEQGKQILLSPVVFAGTSPAEDWEVAQEPLEELMAEIERMDGRVHREEYDADGGVKFDIKVFDPEEYRGVLIRDNLFKEKIDEWFPLKGRKG